MPGHGYHWENALAGILVVADLLDNPLPKTPTSGIYVGTGGDLNVVDMDGNNVLLKNIASGQILPLKLQRVKSAVSNSASNVVLLY